MSGILEVDWLRKDGLEGVWVKDALLCGGGDEGSGMCTSIFWLCLCVMRGVDAWGDEVAETRRGELEVGDGKRKRREFSRDEFFSRCGCGRDWSSVQERCNSAAWGNEVAKTRTGEFEDGDR